MKRITRREILRRIAGISVLGAAGTAIGATGMRAANTPDVRPLASHAITPSTAARSRMATTTILGSPPTSVDHANHATNPSAESIATTGSTSQATAGPTETTGPASSTSTTTATATGVAPTSSAPPVTAVGTSELSGTLGPTLVPAGGVAKIVGDIELRGDLVVEGLLTSVDTFTLRGNGFQIEVRNGGQVDLRGVPKSGWVRGASPSGWQASDRILTAPTEPGRYALSDFHTGAPGAVGLADGRTIVAEQFNLTRSITIDNVSRIMFHMGAGRQVLKHVAVTNSGVPGQLGFYPVHFHLNGNTTRGSIVEGVVVEKGRFHAFVPHASHGIAFLDCVAYSTNGEPFWWDPPPARRDGSNDTHDTVWQHCLAAYVERAEGSDTHRTSAFFLGRGSGNRCIDCTAVGVQGGNHTSGFHWPENAPGIWEFRACVAHNNESTGIFTWQNGTDFHLVEDFIAYRCGRSGIEHGAYANNFSYRNAVITDAEWALRQHALSRDDTSLVFEDIVGNNRLLVDGHKSQSILPNFYRSCRFAGITYSELGNSGSSHNIYENCGLVPSDFDLSGIKSTSVIEIIEGTLLVHRWGAGSWT